MAKWYYIFQFQSVGNWLANDSLSYAKVLNSLSWNGWSREPNKIDSLARDRVGLRGYYNKIMRTGEKVEWVLDMINSCCRWTMFRHGSRWSCPPLFHGQDPFVSIPWRTNFLANKLVNLRCNTLSILVSLHDA